MALDFPNSPNDGDTVQQPNGVTYVWEAALTRWNVFSTAGQKIDTTVVQVKTVTITDRQTGSTVVPIDDTIPQFNEGDAIVGLAIDFTPKFADSLLLLRLSLSV